MKRVALYGLILANLSAFQPVGARVRPVWAPILSDEVRNSNTIDGRFIFYDPDAGIYVLRYKPAGSDLVKLRPLVLADQAQVIAETNSIAALHNASDSDFEYRFSFLNSKDSKASIRSVNVSLPKADSDVTCSHASWGNALVQPSVAPSGASQATPSQSKFRLSLGDWRFVTWTAPGIESLKPGTQVTGFQCRSKFLPGWVTAYFPAGGDYAMIEDAPREAADQLGAMLKMEYQFESVILFGPKYPPESPKRIIAADFLHGLQVLEDRGQLDAKSSFVIALRRQLELLAEGQNVEAVALGAGVSRVEKELLMSLRLSLTSYFR
ncbi:MAG: hypothetical protein ACK532_09930 [Acidobacteriota bacterium]|jgi:hypothetical protein